MEPTKGNKATAVSLLADIEVMLDLIMDWEESGRDNEVFAEYEVADLLGLLGAVEHGLNDLRALVMEHLA